MRTIFGPLFAWLSLLLLAGCSSTSTPADAGTTAGAAGIASTPAGGAGGTTATGGGGAGGAAAGAAGSGGDANRPAKPSAGCGQMNPTKGARTIMTGGQSAMFNVNLPASYDANKPMPLGFGFHGFGNGACGPTQGECRGF